MRRWTFLAGLLALGCARVETPDGAGGAPDAATADAEPGDDVDAAPGVDAAAPGGVDAAAPGCPAAAACGARECGADPVCGVSCGRCPEQHRCDDGACACAPACDGRACGDDACGGRCGECLPGTFCDGVRCREVPSQCPGAADCGGRACGPDPICGTECGACPAGHRCEDGQCRCVADCRGLACGSDPVCGTDCGGCPDGQRCDGGRCRCVPACDGRACGDDGCGGSCGACAPGFACGADGRCACAGTACGAQACCGAGDQCVDGRCCPQHWRREVAGAGLATLLAAPDGRVYAAGASGGRIRVTAIDACGDPVAETPVVVHQEAASSATSLAWADGDLLVAGTLEGFPDDPAQGFFARLGTPGLQVRWAQPLVGSLAYDEIFGIAAVPGGPIFMSGAADARQPSRGFWVVTGDLTGAACGWNGAPGHAGAGRGLTYDAATGRVWVAGMVDDRLALRGFDAGCAPAREPCACEAVFEATAPPAAGDVSAEGRRVVLRGGDAYVVGFGVPADAANVFGLAVRFDLRTGEARERLRWDPTGRTDVLLAALPTDEGLLLAGARDWPQGESFERATAVVLRVSPDLRLLGEHVVGPGTVADLAAVPGAVYVGWTGDGRAGVARCRPTGECP